MLVQSNVIKTRYKIIAINTHTHTHTHTGAGAMGRSNRPFPGGSSSSGPSAWAQNRSLLHQQIWRKDKLVPGAWTTPGCSCGGGSCSGMDRWLTDGWLMSSEAGRWRNPRKGLYINSGCNMQGKRKEANKQTSKQYQGVLPVIVICRKGMQRSNFVSSSSSAKPEHKR